MLPRLNWRKIRAELGMAMGGGPTLWILDHIGGMASSSWHRRACRNGRWPLFYEDMIKGSP